MTRIRRPSHKDVDTRHPCQNSDPPQNLSSSEDSSAKIVARNASFLMLGQVMSTALAILFSSALGRTLGASDFGLYFMLVSFSTFAYVVIDWGQQVYVTREAARQPKRGSVLLGAVLVLRTAGAALVAVLSGLRGLGLGLRRDDLLAYNRLHHREPAFFSCANLRNRISRPRSNGSRRLRVSGEQDRLAFARLVGVRPSRRDSECVGDAGAGWSSCPCVRRPALSPGDNEPTALFFPNRW